MDKFIGSFTLDPSKDENIDGFFDAQGVPEQARQFMKKAVTRTLRQESDGSFAYEIGISEQRLMTQRFKLDVPFEHTTPSGAKMTTTITYDGEAMVDTSEVAGKVATTRTTFEGDYYLMTMTASNGVVAKRYFRKNSTETT